MNKQRLPTSDTYQARQRWFSVSESGSGLDKYKGNAETRSGTRYLPAGRLPSQRDVQILSRTMISVSGAAKTSAGRQFFPAGRRKTQRGEWWRTF